MPIVQSATERNCRWLFIPENKNHQKQGFEGMEELFKVDIIGSFIREVLQNSTDARLDKSKPTHVKMSFGYISKENYPNFFELSKHVDACVTDNGYHIATCNNINAIINSPSKIISFLKVSDYNTTGLSKNSIRKVIYSTGFGRGAEDNGKGGAFGYGHNAYISMSPIRSFLVSSFDIDGIWSFSGLSALTSHEFQGKEVSNFGYYTSDIQGSELKEKNSIPVSFRRNESEGSGTDLFIMGCSDDKELIHEIVQATLINYWLAIYQEKLTIEIKSRNGITSISKDNLDNLLQEFFKDANLKYYNPLPVYRAVVYHSQHNTDKQNCYLFFKEELPLIGEVKLFVNINRNEGLDKGVQYMRGPSMLIKATRLGNNIPYEFSALFICDNPEGDRILRSMESPSHDNWNIKNSRISDSLKKKYASVPDSIIDFVRNTIAKIFTSKDTTTIQFDLGQLLNPFASTSSASVESTNGRERGVVKEKKEKVAVKIVKKKGSESLTPVKGTGKNPGGNKYSSGKGPHPTHTPGGNPRPGEGQTFDDMDETKEGKIGKIFEVDYDMIAIKKNDGQIWHRLFISPSHTYSDCYIHIAIGTDISNNDKNIEIIEAKNKDTQLKTNGNCIRGIDFVKGSQSIIDILLSDGMKHSLTISTYRNE